jgi:ribosomal protein L12E/L44/L45/RPP1/RPP2
MTSSPIAGAAEAPGKKTAGAMTARTEEEEEEEHQQQQQQQEKGKGWHL